MDGDGEVVDGFGGFVVVVELDCCGVVVVGYLVVEVVCYCFGVYGGVVGEFDVVFECECVCEVVFVDCLVFC